MSLVSLNRLVYRAPQLGLFVVNIFCLVVKGPVDARHSRHRFHPFDLLRSHRGSPAMGTEQSSIRSEPVFDSDGTRTSADSSHGPGIYNNNSNVNYLNGSGTINNNNSTTNYIYTAAGFDYILWVVPCTSRSLLTGT